jgi:hypothetical protein
VELANGLMCLAYRVVRAGRRGGGRVKGGGMVDREQRKEGRRRGGEQGGYIISRLCFQY